jgi:hypothetical protein
MAQPLDPNDRFRLLSAWCDGSIRDAQLEQLDELLRTDPEFRKFYLAYMDLHAVLASDVLPLDEPLRVHRGLRLAAHDSDWEPSVTKNRLPGKGIADFAARVRLPGGAGRWRTAAAILAVALVGLTVWIRHKSQPKVPVVARRPATVAPPRSIRPNGFAVVIQLAGVEWDGPEARRVSQGEILSPCRLAIRSGQLTLGLLSGVTLTVEGPADFDLVAIDRIHCRQGKLRTRVPRGAEGFIVSTPGSAVVDRGTEFALNVSSDGKARVMVFEGEAEAAVLNALGSPLRSQQIVERHALDIDPRSGQLEESMARTEDYVVPPVLAVPPLSLPPAYRAAVLNDEPWGYWRFESMERRRITSEVAGSPDLRSTGPIRVVLAGAQNRCVEFGADGSEQYVLMDRVWEPPTDPGYAIELWVLPERIGHAALASLIGAGRRGDDYKHLALIELTATDRETLLPPASPPGSVRFLHRWPAGDSGGDNIFSADYYIPYRWHHLVAQKNGDLLELYMDGEPTQPVRVRDDVATEACRVLLGRLKPLPRLPGKVHSRPFVGRIDELALYNHPLSPEEVRRHYELGIHGGK